MVSGILSWSQLYEGCRLNPTGSYSLKDQPEDTALRGCRAVAPRRAEPTAQKGCTYSPRITETSSVYLIPRAQSLRHLEIQQGKLQNSDHVKCITGEVSLVEKKVVEITSAIINLLQNSVKFAKTRFWS